MNKVEIIKMVEDELVSVNIDCEPILVNFVDDEIYWDKIAKVVIDFLSNAYGERVPWEQLSQQT